MTPGEIASRLGERLGRVDDIAGEVQAVKGRFDTGNIEAKKDLLPKMVQLQAEASKILNEQKKIREEYFQKAHASGAAAGGQGVDPALIQQVEGTIQTAERRVSEINGLCNEALRVLNRMIARLSSKPPSPMKESITKQTPIRAVRNLAARSNTAQMVKGQVQSEIRKIFTSGAPQKEYRQIEDQLDESERIFMRKLFEVAGWELKN